MNKEDLQTKLRNYAKDKELSILEKSNFEEAAAIKGCVINWKDLSVKKLKLK